MKEQKSVFSQISIFFLNSNPGLNYSIHRSTLIVEHVYMRPKVNSNSFEISNHFEKLLCLHGDFTAANFQTIIEFYFKCENDNF